MKYAALRHHRPLSIARTVLIAGLLAAVALTVGGRVDTTHLAEAVRRSPVPAPLLAIVGCAVLVCVFVPRTVLALAAGTMFGGYLGTVWTVLGVTAGAMCAYAVGKLVGRDWVAARLGSRAAAIDHLATTRGPWVVAAARMIPLVHFGTSNYMFGTTSVSWLAYATGTAIGVIPGTVAYAALGASTAHGSASATSIASAAVITLSCIGITGSALLVRLVTKLPRGVIEPFRVTTVDGG